MTYAQKQSTKNEFDKDFFARMQIAQKQAIELREFPLYYTEPGALVFTQTMMGAMAGVYYTNQYLAANPQIVDNFMYFLNFTFNLFSVSHNVPL